MLCLALVEVSGFIPAPVPGARGRARVGGVALAHGKPIGEATSTPAVVVAFGFTEQERCAAEAVLAGGHVFPGGVRVVGAAAPEGTLREVR